MFRATVFLMAAAAALGAAPASADSDIVTGTVVVSGLDFTRAGDIKQFERRVRQKARLLCNVGSRADLNMRLAERECQTSVNASAQRELPQLVAAARARSGVRLATR